MQLRQATTFIASTAFFLPASVNASLLRGIDGEFEIGDNLEITEDRPGTFLRVSESDAADPVYLFYAQPSSAILYCHPMLVLAVVSFIILVLLS